MPGEYQEALEMDSLLVVQRVFMKFSGESLHVPLWDGLCQRSNWCKATVPGYVWISFKDLQAYFSKGIVE